LIQYFEKVERLINEFFFLKFFVIKIPK